MKTVHIRDPLHEALRTLAFQRQETLRALVHEAVREYLESWHVPILPESPDPRQRTLLEVLEEQFAADEAAEAAEAAAAEASAPAEES